MLDNWEPVQDNMASHNSSQNEQTVAKLNSTRFVVTFKVLIFDRSQVQSNLSVSV